MPMYRVKIPAFELTIETDDAQPQPGGGAAGLWVSGYIVGYQRDHYPNSAIDFSALSHLMIGATLPRVDGSVSSDFYLGAEGLAWAKDAAARAKAAGKKPILMVGGAGNLPWGTVTSDATRPAFVRNLLALMDSVGAVGLDIDWEPIADADKGKVISLAQNLRAARSGLILTIPLGWQPINKVLDRTWHSALAAVYDQVNIMFYSAAGSWPGWTAGFHAPLRGAGPSTPVDLVTTVQAYLNGGVPPKKLGIGLGFYGLGYTPPVTGPGQALNGSQSNQNDNELSYFNLMRDYFKMERFKWDDTAQMGYLASATPFGPKQLSFVSYEDERSIAAKAAFVKEKGLGGTIIWTLGLGHLPGAPDAQPLLTATKKAFL